MSLYSPNTDPKYQTSEEPRPVGLPEDVIISEDTHRENRLRPVSIALAKWPVLHASIVPVIDPAKWTLRIHGLVSIALELTLAQFRELPRIKVFADFSLRNHVGRDWGISGKASPSSGYFGGGVKESPHSRSLVAC